MAVKNSAKSYHLVHHKDGTDGPEVRPCATTPCSLHSGTDFMASSPEQARQIGEAIVASMYSNDNMGLTAKEANQVVENHEKRNADMNNWQAYSNGDGSQSDKDFYEAMKFAVKNGNVNPNEKFVEASVDPEQSIRLDDSFKAYADSLDDASIDGIVNNSKDSYAEIYEEASKYAADGEHPSKADMAHAALALEAARRAYTQRDDYAHISEKEEQYRRTQANAIISGRKNLDDIYANTPSVVARRAELQKQLSELDGVSGKEASKQRAKIKNQIKSTHKMPAAVKTRIMQNAWANASNNVQNKLLRNGDEALKYAPASRIASFVSHTRPPKAVLAACKDAEERAKCIRDYRFSRLDALIRNDSPTRDMRKFKAAILAGAINKNDAKAWVNKHPVDPEHVDDTIRFTNSYLQLVNVPQGNPGVDFETGQRRYKSRSLKGLSRDSSVYKSRQAFNRNEYRSYVNNKMQPLMHPENFKDKNGVYDPEAHGRALFELAYGTGAQRKVKDANGNTRVITDNGYLPAATVALAHGKGHISDKAIAHFYTLASKRYEKDLANSRYQVQFSHDHKKKTYIDKKTGKEVEEPQFMRRWHNMGVLVRSMYSRGADDRDFLMGQDKKKDE